MSWCVSHCNAKSIASVCAAIPLGVALALTAVNPARAQFADTSPTSQPSSPSQETTSNLQSNEEGKEMTQAGYAQTALPGGSTDDLGAIAQFTPNPEPSDANPLPITTS